MSSRHSWRQFECEVCRDWAVIRLTAFCEKGPWPSVHRFLVQGSRVLWERLGVKGEKGVAVLGSSWNKEFPRKQLRNLQYILAPKLCKSFSELALERTTGIMQTSISAGSLMVSSVNCHMLRGLNPQPKPPNSKAQTLDPKLHTLNPKTYITPTSPFKGTLSKPQTP